MRRPASFDLPTAELCFAHILTEVGMLLGHCFSSWANPSGWKRAMEEVLKQFLRW